MIESTTATVGQFHAVKFYDAPASMSVAVARFIAAGLAEQQPALILAMPEDHAGILAALRHGYVDVDRAGTAGDFLLLDASDVLARVMVDGMPDPHAFNTVTRAILAQLLRGRTGCSVRIYGGMVSYLWETGHPAAALGVERLWNVLALTHPFSLLCGYALGPYGHTTEPAQICAQHSHVIAPPAPLWLTHGGDCPACGTPLPPGPSPEVVYRCIGCRVELIDCADAHEFVVHHLQARASTRAPASPNPGQEF